MITLKSMDRQMDINQNMDSFTVIIDNISVARILFNMIMKYIIIYTA